MTQKKLVYEFSVQRIRAYDAPLVKGVNSSASAAKLARDLIGSKDREYFLTFYVDVALDLVGFEITAVGSASWVEVHPQEVFRGAILAGAKAVVLAHNHPSGNPKLSEGDLELVSRFVSCGTILDIEVLDLLAVTESSWSSVRQPDVVNF